MTKKKPIFINTQGIPEIIKEVGAFDETLIQLASDTENGLMVFEDKLKLNSLKNPILYVDFSYSDFVGGSKLVGSISANTKIINVGISVDTVFDNNAQITVGDVLDNSRLSSEELSDLSSGNAIYDVDSDYTYTSNSNIYIYFQSTPSVGTGSVTIHIG